MQFKEIVGNQAFKKRLIHNIEGGRVAHAQIFEGKSGYQSLSYAVAYAQYLNCTNPQNGDSCGVCNSCLKSAKLEHPDIYFIYPVGVPLGKKGKKEDYVSSDFIEEWRSIFLSNKPKGCFSESDWYRISGIGGEKGNSQGSIGRSEADEIFEKVSYSPTDGGFRIFIIWLPERMNRAVANSLLKLFEEPSDKTVFLFVSENPAQVLPTILSRSQNMTIPSTESDEIYNYLKTISPAEDKVLKTISGVANGDISSAVTMLSDINRENEELEAFITLTRICYTANIEAILEWVEDFVVLNKEEQKRFFRKAVDILRSSYMVTIGVENLSYMHGKENDFVKNFHKVIHSKNIDTIIGEFERTFKELSQNGNSRIVVTHFALSLITQLKIKA